MREIQRGIPIAEPQTRGEWGEMLPGDSIAYPNDIEGERARKAALMYGYRTNKIFITRKRWERDENDNLIQVIRIWRKT